MAGWCATPVEVRGDWQDGDLGLLRAASPQAYATCDGCTVRDRDMDGVDLVTQWWACQQFACALRAAHLSCSHERAAKTQTCSTSVGEQRLSALNSSHMTSLVAMCNTDAHMVPRSLLPTAYSERMCTVPICEPRHTAAIAILPGSALSRAQRETYRFWLPAFRLRAP